MKKKQITWTITQFILFKYKLKFCECEKKANNLNYNSVQKNSQLTTEIVSLEQTGFLLESFTIQKGVSPQTAECWGRGCLTTAQRQPSCHAAANAAAILPRAASAAAAACVFWITRAGVICMNSFSFAFCFVVCHARYEASWIRHRRWRKRRQRQRQRRSRGRVCLLQRSLLQSWLQQWWWEKDSSQETQA